MLIRFLELKEKLFEILLLRSFQPEDAQVLVDIFSETTLDGVFSHGVNRFPLFIDLVEKGVIMQDAKPELISKFGTTEQWDGCKGPGILNARFCMNQAIQLAKEHRSGFVTLRNTNHWMRGGTYGWQAANAGVISICFTNTNPNMPPWGGKDSRIGNNPLIIAIPREEGHIVLDMALSQFSFGKIHQYKLDDQKLPFPGGFDNEGNLTDDPAVILNDERGLPIGYWKGSGLSIMLDLFSSLLSGGNSTYRVGKGEFETGLSQIFMCWDMQKYSDAEFQRKIIQEVLDYVHHVEPLKEGLETYYPGEKTLRTRKKQLKEGIEINANIWDQILNLMP